MSTTPICRCRVLYLGSSVPHITKDGLQGIQEPLRELYPDQGPFTAKGIDSWLSVWSNGLLLENVDESRRQITRFFPIESLHYCAAVRYVVVPGGSSDRVEKFLPLDSPFAKHATTQPPLFACILRRTSGIKVLECHAFIAKKETAANALVRCCFHAYADSMYARQLEENPYYMETKRAQMPAFSPVDKVEAWRHLNGRELPERPSPSNGTNGHHAPPSESDLTNANDKTLDEENYKVWVGAAPTEREMIYMDTAGTVRSVRSTTAGSTLGGNQAGINKPNRPRQMILPAGPPPPPPIPPAGLGGRPGPNNGKGNNKKAKGGKYGANGYPNVHPGQHHQHSIYAAAGYYSERQAKRVERPVLSSMEEPLYLPSTRPLSPTASYQPGQFPYEQYYSLQQQQQQQYATTTRTGKKNKKKSGDKSDKSSDADSPFNTGIYRKKGHLNERAFSYSIRQEHRSRSTSLANLHFMTDGEGQPPTENGHATNGNVSAEELSKKERELAQMVTDLRIRENGHGSHGHHQHASTNGGGPGPSGHQSSSHHSGSSDSNFIRKKAPAYHQR